MANAPQKVLSPKALEREIRRQFRHACDTEFPTLLPGDRFVLRLEVRCSLDGNGKITMHDSITCGQCDMDMPFALDTHSA